MLRNGEISSWGELAAKSITFVEADNRRPAQFAWTYDGQPLKVA